MADDQARGAAAESPEEISRILKTYRVVAVVGLSTDPGKASHQVASYLQRHGYRIVPVNPGCQEVLGEKCYPSLKDIPFPVEVVDIFRKPQAIPGVVDEAIAVGAKVVWMQLGLKEPAAAAKAREAGLSVVQDRCLKIEHHERLA
jgi:predicted CoA-binding protein